MAKKIEVERKECFVAILTKGKRYETKKWDTYTNTRKKKKKKEHTQNIKEISTY